AQDCAKGATLGKPRKVWFNPARLVSAAAPSAQPLQVDLILSDRPRVAASRQPSALGQNRFAIQEHSSHATACLAAASAASRVGNTRPAWNCTGVHAPWSSGSRRNSSKPKLPSGRRKRSTQRSCWSFSRLASTTQSFSRRWDTAPSHEGKPGRAAGGGAHRADDRGEHVVARDAGGWLLVPGSDARAVVTHRLNLRVGFVERRI